MNDTNTDDLSHPGEWHIEKHEYSNAACTSAVKRVYRGKELDSTIETRKWKYPNPVDKSPTFDALDLTEEEWPSLAARDGTVVEPDVPEIVDVTLRLYASVGLDEDNEESEYGFLGSGEDRTYVHHTKRYVYAAEDHVYPETEWNGAAYYYQSPRSHWHNTRSKDDAVPVFYALVQDDKEWPTLSSQSPEDFPERTFHPFSNLPLGLQLMVLERSNLVLDTPKHTGIYLRTDRVVALGCYKLVSCNIPVMAACSCSLDCWQKWNGSCCCSHKRFLYKANDYSASREYDSWPSCPSHESYRNGLMGLTSKSTREAALKIFYGRNQFYLEGNLWHDIPDVLRSSLEHWPYEMSLIEQTCMKLSIENWRRSTDAARDGFLRCIKKSFQKDKLKIRFVIDTSTWGPWSSEPSGPIGSVIKGFCKEVMEAELGTIEVLVSKLSRSNRNRSCPVISTLSGSLLEMTRQIDDYGAQGLL